MSDSVRPSSFFGVVSFLSGSSLIFFGIVSLAITLFSFGWLAVFVSMALLVHGVVELVARNRVLNDGSRVHARVLVRNQLALALSVSIYSLGMILQQDGGALQSELIREILVLYPSEVRQMIEESIPMLTRIFYSLVILVVCVGAASTAFYYDRQTRGLSGS
ncbi:hypothetical protein MLD52_20580 [Puniceicoccaceae bacterium K14]|nr:hypothetical protein [Puniceicoccaceae bacterium K14]